jgi:hypothetical protein
VVVVDGLVAFTASNRTDVLVERIGPERYRLIFVGTPEVAVHRFPDHGSDTDAAT